LLTLFLLSALLSAAVAYDPARSLAKFWLVLGAWGLYYALAHQHDLLHLYGALALFGLLGVALALFFLATHDWSTTTKMPALAVWGRQVGSWLPALQGHRLTPNVAGGMMAVLLPLYAPLIALPGRHALLGCSRAVRRGLRVLWATAAALVALGCALSASRGAWGAALAVGTAWLLWRFLEVAIRGRDAARVWRARLLSMVLLGLAVVIVALGLACVVSADSSTARQAVTNRWGLWRDAALLARDYAFTGLGLGLFEMPFSIYTLLIHVGYIVNSHNLFLDILVEQGTIGLGLYLGLVVVALVYAVRALRGARRVYLWVTEAALASLGVGLLHGLVDDVLYGSRGLLLLFVPLGLIVAARQAASREPNHQESANTPELARGALAPLGVVGGLVLVVVALGWRPISAAWQANLGALAQTRIELAVYDQWHFDNPNLDQVRQTQPLEAALERFERALALDPGNITARRRLALVALARGDYAAARLHMERAWADGHRDRATRLLLGDALVAADEPDVAAEIIRGVPWARARLEGQAWSRYRGTPQQSSVQQALRALDE
jgi:O-antigen ligase